MSPRTSQAITGWPAYALAVLLLPVAAIVSILPFKKTVDWTPAEVAGFLRGFIDDTCGEWDWDEFENVPITDPALDAIRLEAIMAGPPNVDSEKLAQLLARVESKASGQVFE